jgi:ribosomal protein S13
MTPILRFLQSLRSLQKSGVIKSVDEAYDFAKREFGEINDLLKRQIEEIFNKPKGGITSIKREPKGEVIEASFKPGMDKRGRVIEESPSQASGIMSKIEESGKKLEGAANRMSEIQKEIDAMYKPKPDTSPLMERLEGGIEALKQMKQPGMDLTTGLTRTSVRKILDRAGIQVPDKVDPIEVFEKNFGGDALMDVKDVAEEMIELERMGKSTKSMDEILEQSGMFDIKRNPDAPKGLSDEEIERIKKEVDQEKQIKDFDPTDREPNSMGGINRTNFATGTKLIMAIINSVKKLKPMDAMKEMNEVVAKRGKYKDLSDDEVKKIFDETNDHIFERDVPADEFAVNFDDILNDVDEAYGVTPDMKKELDEMAKLAPKAAERFKLKERFPGIDDRLLTQIIDDPDPQRKAEVIATIDQAFELMRQGKSQEEVYDIMKQMTDRTKQAKGGLSYLMGM